MKRDHPAFSTVATLADAAPLLQGNPLPYGNNRRLDTLLLAGVIFGCRDVFSLSAGKEQA
jgi:hypothetical protein